MVHTYINNVVAAVIEADDVTTQLPSNKQQYKLVLVMINIVSEQIFEGKNYHNYHRVC